MFDNLNIDTVKQTMSFTGKSFPLNCDDLIPTLQTQGVTALCKILNIRQYAYLADEVGMGKTYQALGVISMLLKEKPDTKILIIAPNRSVQTNWISEIRSFQNNILKENLDLKVKNFDEKNDFIKEFKEKSNTKIFLTRLTIFSTIGDSIVRYENPKYSYMEKIPVKKIFEGLYRVTGANKSVDSKDEFYSLDTGKICGKFLRNYTPYFDLVVIDEAQNMRNENNATVFLNYWLGLKRWNDKSSGTVDGILKKIKLTVKERVSKFLLISATPAHRNIESLRNQLLYFENICNIPPACDITHEYLSDFLVRRLRIYNNENKYNVRNISPNDVSRILETDDKNGLRQRLFMALVQSKLARETAKNNSTYKIGFLETFESYNPSKFFQNDDETGEKEFENNGSQKEGEKGAAPDKIMLQNLSRSFYDSFGTGKYPPHPKFSFMEGEIDKLLNTNIHSTSANKNAPDKAVIFVRRLATVDELNLRLNQMYEDRIISYWGRVFGLNDAKLQDIQIHFENLYNNKTARNCDTEDSNDAYEEENKEGQLIISQLQNWITLKKQHKGRGYYAVSKFKKSLLRNKTNSFLFSENYLKTLEPECNIDCLVDSDFVKDVNEHIGGDYKRYILEYSGQRRFNNTELLPLCCYLALKKIGNEKHSSLIEKIKEFYSLGSKVEGKHFDYNANQIKRLLKQDSLWNQISEYGIDISINETNFKKREVLKGVVEKYLKSSEAVLELIYCYISSENDKLCKSIMDRLFSEHCTHGIRIKNLFKNGDLVYKQLLGGNDIKYDSSLRTELKFLDLQQWVMPATGGNKGNEGLIKRFNTPFYPDVIVCTDVLKEGINLHLFCNRIYHYGLAWTPGDLEQRIGRIDRFFSKTHRERTEQKNISNQMKTKIEVNYPYLGKSVDEHQLKQVLKFKLSADPLLDSKKINQKDINIDINEVSVDELARNMPNDEDITPCPYSGEKFWK